MANRWVESERCYGGIYLWPMLGLMLVAVACAPGNETTPDAGPFDDLPFAPGSCGLPAYEWLPPAEVGDVVFADAHPLSPIRQEDIAAILDDVGLSEIGPAEHGVEIFEMRYGTQDRGQRVEATGLVAIPSLAPGTSTADFPVLVWLHGTTGFTGACAPSRLGGDNLGFALLAALGFVVVAPDYIGLDADLPEGELPKVTHAYLGVEQVALGTLDMVRAAKALLQDIPTPVVPSDQTLLWGGSQGGHAAFSVDRLIPYYAPELDVVAMVALVPPTDLNAQAVYATTTLNQASGALPAMMASLSRWHGQSDALSAALRSDGPVNLPEEIPYLMDTTCDFSSFADEIDSLDDIFTSSFLAQKSDFYGASPWGCILQRNSILDTDIPLRSATPTLFQISQLDTLVDANTERSGFEKLCAQGYRLHFLECADASHTEGALWSLPEQLSFIRARLGQGPDEAAPECEVQAPVRCRGMP